MKVTAKDRALAVTIARRVGVEIGRGRFSARDPRVADTLRDQQRIAGASAILAAFAEGLLEESKGSGASGVPAKLH